MTEERRKNRSELPLQAAKKQMQYIAAKGNFKAAILVDEDGLSMLHIDSDYNHDKLAALAGVLQQSGEKVQDLADFTSLKQMSMSDFEGNTVICRFFNVSHQPVSLVVVTDSEIMNPGLAEQAVAGIVRILENGA